MNEECGFIQWVPNTIPIRPVLLKFYEAKRIKSWVSQVERMACILLTRSRVVKWLPHSKTSRTETTKTQPRYSSLKSCLCTYQPYGSA